MINEDPGKASWFDVEHGGQVLVYKDRFEGPGWRSDIAAERWEAGEILGRPVAIGRAVLRDELGESAVVVWDAERKIQVVIRAFDVELESVLSVAREVLE